MNSGWKHVAMNRFPIKHAWDALSLAQVLLRGDMYYGGAVGLAERLRCIDFYLNACGVDRLFAMLPRSGSHWSGLGMALAIDLANGGDGQYVFRNGEFYPRDGIASQRFDWRVPLGLDDAEYARQRSDGPAFGKLLYFHSRQPYFRIRSAQLKKMRIVVLTRSILASLEARRLKFAMAVPNMEAYLADEEMFDWDAALSRSIEFFNSWGDVLRWHPRIRHYRHEDLVADPVTGHQEILDFWGFKLPVDIVAEAFRRVTREEMKKTIPPELAGGTYRIANETKDRRAAPSESKKRHIIGRLRCELVFDLGHRHDDSGIK